MSKKSIKTQGVLSKIFMYLSIIVFSVIAVLFLIQNNIILFLLAFFIITYISLKENIKNFPLILFITSLIIRVVVIVLMNFPQVSDFKTLLDASFLFANNDYSFQNSNYFSVWGYQTGFVIYQGIILKLFNSVFALKLLNAIYSSLLVLIIYFIGEKLCSKKSAKMVSLLYMIFPFSLYLNSVLANHHLSTFLMYVAILFILKKDKKIKDYVIVAILISFGNIIRPEGIIVVFSIILYEIFRLKKDKVFEVGKKLLIFLLIYLTVGSLSSFLVKTTNINKEGLSNKDPLWKFVLGFNNKTCGYYTDDDSKYLANKQEELKLIKKRALSNPLNTAKLFSCKINKFWLESDISIKNDMYLNKTFNLLGVKIKLVDIEKLVIRFNYLLYILTLFMCIIGVIKNRKKVLESNMFFFLILIIVTFFVYLLIEIQPRYAYFIHISIFILSANGYDYLLNKIKSIISKQKLRTRT